jgi:hypothetical protein|tara:strand:- start:1890 stop:2177 length:288 start_codon:yes stop_codon:yes gene_type:complete
MADEQPTAGKQRGKGSKPKGPSYKELEAEAARLTQENGEWQLLHLRMQAWVAALQVAQMQAGWVSFPGLMAQAQQDTVTAATLPTEPEPESADKV